MPQYDLTINVVGRDKSSGVFSGLSNTLGSIFRIAGGIVAARVFMALAGQLQSVVTAAVNATAQFQNMQIGIEGLVARELSRLTDGARTIAEVFPDARLKAAGLMDELSRLAIVSPYMVETVVNTFKMQMAFGFTTDQAKQMTSGLLNMAAGIGATTPMLERMAYNLAQINLQGKVTKLDIRQLALAGLGLVDVLKYVGKEMGIAIEDHLDFNKAIAAGKITWEDFARLFEKYAEENFAGASERMARTLVGLKSTFHDVFVLTMPKVLGPAADKVTESINKILDLFIFLRESGILESIGERLAGAVEGWLGPFNDFMDRILAYLSLQSQLKSGSIDVAKNMGAIRQEMEKLAPTGDIVRDSLEATFGPKAAEWYDKIRLGLEKFLDRLAWLGRVAGRVWDTVGILLDGLGRFWTNYGDSIAGSVQRVVEALFGFGDPFIQTGMESIEDYARRIADWLAGEGGQRISKGIEDFATWIVEDGIPAAKRFVAWLEEKIPEAIETLTNFWNETLNPALIEFSRIWEENIMPGFENLRQFWDENGDAILEVLGGFVARLLGIGTENTVGNIKNLGEAFEEGTKSMLEDGPAIVENLKNITGTLAGIAETATDPEFVQGVVEIGKLIGTLWVASKVIGIVAALGSIFKWLGPLLTGVGTGAGVALPKLIQLGKWLIAAAGGAGALAAALPLILVGVIALGIVFHDEIAAAYGEFGDWLSGTIEDVSTWAGDVLNSWQSGLEGEDVDALMDAMSQVATDMLGIWTSILGGQVMEAIGAESIQGWWDGWKERFWELWDDMVALMNIWWELWKQISEVESPSKRAYRIGAFIAEGFVEGFTSVKPQMDKALQGFNMDANFPEQTREFTHEYVTVPVNIDHISSDVDIEEMYTKIATRLRYERSMARR